MIGDLFDTRGFTPRWDCGLWSDLHGFTHIAADVIIWAAYMAIPMLLVWLIRRRSDIPFPRIFWLFAAFILSCGLTHLLDALMFYSPIYRFLTLIKVATALVSTATVFALIPLIPKALTLRSSSDLQAEVERRTAELQQSERRIRTLFDSSIAGVISFDETGRIHDWNQQAESLFGPLAGRSIELLFARNGTNGPSLPQHCLFKDRGSLEWQAFRHDGGEFPAEVSWGTADSGGVPLCCLFVRDLSWQQQTREELRRLAMVASRTDNAVVITDAARRIEWVNESFTRLTGYTLEEAKGKKPGAFLQGDTTDPDVIRDMRDALRSEQGIRLEMVNYHKSGAPFVVEMEINPVHDARGRLSNFIALGRDVTRQREDEEAVRSARDRAERATRAKTEFLANMSHEIRTPMTAIVGFIDMLRDPALDESRRDGAIQVIRRNGEHLLDLINSILDLSRIEAGKFAVEPVPFSPIGLIAEVVSLMRVQTLNRDLELDIHFSGRMPREAVSDPVRLRQILINLLGNAIRFTEKGRVTLGAAVEIVAPDRAELKMQVIDTGVGIPAEMLERIFEPFTQADDTVTRVYGGSGLGLTISRRLAEMLGGGLSVRSLVGFGSTFTLTVPLGDPSRLAWVDDPHKALLRLPPADGEAERNEGASLAGYRVLVAEDSLPNRELLRFVLLRAGAVVELVDNGRDAVDRAVERARGGEAYDAVLMDMQMPILDGYSAATMLRRQGYEGPIAALTAHAMSEDREKCLRAGCSDYFTKPIDTPRMLAGLLAICRHERGRRGEGLPHPTPAPPDRPPIDFEALVGRCSGDRGFAFQLVTRAGEIVAEELVRLAEAVGAGESGSIRTVAHTIAGMAGNVSMVALAESCRVLELAADQPVRWEEALSAVRADWDRCRELLELLGPA